MKSMAEIKEKEINRTEQVIIRLSKEEKERLELMAKNNDESVNKFVVKKLFGYKNYTLCK